MEKESSREVSEVYMDFTLILLIQRVKNPQTYRSKFELLIL